MRSAISYLVVGLFSVLGVPLLYFTSFASLFGPRGPVWLTALALSLWSISTFLWVRELARNPKLGTSAEVFLPVAVVAGAASFVLPLLSQDVFLYSAYGRQIAIHHSNPYVTPLLELIKDPVIAAGDPFWYGQTSFHGGLALALFCVAGFLLPNASLGSLARAIKLIWLVPHWLFARAISVRWREQPKGVALVVAIVGNPVFIYLVLLEAHFENWLLVFLTMSGLSMIQGRPAQSSIYLALATGFKMPAVVLAPVCACWFWSHSRRSAVTFVSTYVVLYGGYLLLLSGAEWPGILGYSKLNESVEFGAVVPQVLFLLGVPLAAIPKLCNGLFCVAEAAIGLLALTGRWRRNPFFPLAMALAALYFTRLYVQSWYTLWFWPLMWLSKDDPLPAFRSIAIWTICAVLSNLYIAALTPWVVAALFVLDLGWNYADDFRRLPSIETTKGA